MARKHANSNWNDQMYFRWPNRKYQNFCKTIFDCNLQCIITPENIFSHSVAWYWQKFSQWDPLFCNYSGNARIKPGRSYDLTKPWHTKFRLYSRINREGTFQTRFANPVCINPIRWRHQLAQTAVCRNKLQREFSLGGYNCSVWRGTAIITP